MQFVSLLRLVESNFTEPFMKFLNNLKWLNLHFEWEIGFADCDEVIGSFALARRQEKFIRASSSSRFMSLLVLSFFSNCVHFPKLCPFFPKSFPFSKFFPFFLFPFICFSIAFSRESRSVYRHQNCKGGRSWSERSMPGRKGRCGSIPLPSGVLAGLSPQGGRWVRLVMVFWVLLTGHVVLAGAT